MDDGPVLGGFVVCRPQPLTYRVGDEFGFALLSDLHIGAAHVDYRAIEKELAEAGQNGDRILINGDVLDAIVSSDKKRFNNDVLHPRLQGRRDAINAAIEWAVEMLSPYAHQIDMVGCGNHETTLEKYANFDPIAVIVYQLQREARKRDKGHRVHHGGYTGFVDYRLEDANQSEGRDRPNRSLRWVLYYHHGSGGAAPVTRGMIDFARKDAWVDADMIWMGHKHQRLNVSVQKLSCPVRGKSPKVRDVRHVMTGAYFRTYVGQSQKSIRKHGRRTNYAADMGLGPGGAGGARVVLSVPPRGREYRVSVIQ